MADALASGLRSIENVLAELVFGLKIELAKMQPGMDRPLLPFMMRRSREGDAQGGGAVRRRQVPMKPVG